VSQLAEEFSSGYSYGSEPYIRHRELNSTKGKRTKEQNEYALIVALNDYKDKRLLQDGLSKSRCIRLLEGIKDLGFDLSYSAK